MYKNAEEEISRKKNTAKIFKIVLTKDNSIRWKGRLTNKINEKPVENKKEIELYC